MNKLLMDFNIGLFDKCNRLLMGSVLLILAMSMNAIPPWIALLALYPILTAITAWDPVYAIAGWICRGLANKLSMKDRSKDCVNINFEGDRLVLD
jgi:hypothetical protein